MKTIRVRGLREEIPVGKILCLGRNYAEHAKEMQSDVPDRPLVFIKPSTALISDGQDILIPRLSREVHHEVELVVAIGKTGKHLQQEQAKEHILGYGVGLDMTLRDVQNEAKRKGLPWSIAKGFDTSAPVSDIVPASMIANPAALEIQCRVNGTLRQKSRADQMIFSVEQIISYLSTLFTLERGDLIFTGTPAGVGTVVAGDRIEAELIGWTKITHTIKSE
jgi:5-carboxymethyl-2-hydroxymuconate isomerase